MIPGRFCSEALTSNSAIPKSIRPMNGFAHLVKNRISFFRGVLPGENSEPHFHDRQGVANLVRDTGCEPSHVLKFLCLDQLRLRSLQFLVRLDQIAICLYGGLVGGKKQIENLATARIHDILISGKLDGDSSPFLGFSRTPVRSVQSAT